MKKLIAYVTFPTTTTGNPFNGSPKEYRFLTTIEDLEAGDTVVVDTLNGLQIANFTGYSNEPQEFGEAFNHKKARYLIQKIDLAEHNRRLEATAELERVKKQMEVRRKAAQELEIYAILAEKDPTMKELLESFHKLQGEI